MNRRSALHLAPSGVVLEAGERAGRDDDESRRYYRLTPLGPAVARAEARRLEEMVRLSDKLPLA